MFKVIIFRNKYLILLVALILLATQAMAQTKISVKGKVIDELTKTSLESVNISNSKGGGYLGTTDTAGNFTILVVPGTTVLFSYAGYDNLKYEIKDGTELLITLQSKQVGKKDEVIVTGFTQKNKDLTTGAATRLMGDKIQNVPVSNFVDLMQGRVAGLNIQNNTGSPGAVGTINLRGTSQIGISQDGFLTPASPLFIIDGIQVDINSNYNYNNNSSANNVNPLSLIPPDDIETMDVLKDAAAMSLYGSRAANGVIIVTTKRGRSQIPQVNYRGDIFFRRAPGLLPTIGGNEERRIRINTILNYDTLRDEALKSRVNQANFLTDSLNPYYNNATDWQEIYFRPSANQTHNLQVSGGNNSFAYKMNLNYLTEKGIVKNTDYERFGLNLQTTYNPNENFRLLASISAAYGARGNGTSVTGVQTGVATSAASSSLLPPPSLYDINSAAAGEDNRNNVNRINNISGSVDIQYSFLKGFIAQNAFSYNYFTNNNNLFIPSALSGSAADVRFFDDRNYNLTNRALLRYTSNLGEHTISPFVFGEINSYGAREYNIRLAGTANDQIKGPLGYEWSRSQGGIANIRDTRQLGYGGEIFYSYARKYILQGTYRLDLSSSNGPAQGFEHSPSISGRWNFFKEKFLENATWLSEGALRGSWGKVTTPVGNIFNVFGRYVVGDPYNNNPTVSLDFGTVPNNSFAPQIVTQFNLGTDLGFFNNRVRISVDAYYKATDNQLTDIFLNSSTAFGTYTLNGASVVNRGIEFTGDFSIINKTDLKVSLNTNFAIDRSTLVKLPDGLRERTISINDGGSNIPVLQRIGRPQISSILFINKGVYANTADVPVDPNTGLRMQFGKNSNVFFKAGDPIWVDVNGDYIIDDQDLMPVGNPIPLLVGGFNPTIQYKQFTMNASFAITLKRDIINQVLAGRMNAYTTPGNINALQNISGYNYWKPTNEDLSSGTSGAVYPNPFDYIRAGAIGSFRSNQSLYLEDGSYVKLNSVAVLYRFRRELIARYGLVDLQFRASMNNVFTLSRYSGINPENVSSLGRDISGGYPNALGYSVGIGIIF